MLTVLVARDGGCVEGSGREERTGMGRAGLAGGVAEA